MKLKIAICDDEQNQIEYITSLVTSWSAREGHNCEIRAFESAEAFLFEYEDDKSCNILLLDIEMGTMNGVELAKTIRQSNDTIQIVFITGFPDFIGEGYEVAALHYLMKPVSAQKLSQVLDRAVAAIGKQPRTVLLNVGRESICLAVDDILYAESQAHYMIVRTPHEEYKCRMTISELTNLLGDGFARCHRSFLVGLRHISRITKTDVHIGGVCLPLGKGMYDGMNLALIQYLRGM